MEAGEMKVVSIVPYKIFPAQLGGEKGIAVFNEFLAARVTLSVVTVRANLPSFAKGYRVRNILQDSRWRYINPALFFRLRKILIDEQATHLIIEHPYYGWLAGWLRRSLLRWVVHSHNIEYMRSKSIGRWWWKGLKWYEGWTYRRADMVFFISEDDRQHAIEHLGVLAERSMEVTYGIEWASAPDDRAVCRQKVAGRHGIVDGERILLFNGALYHSTNYDALNVILEKLNPFLLETGLSYKIIVCGRGLPDFFNELRDYREKNVLFAGFVDDVSEYFRAADVFLNPILSGGGVKTKAIEALAMGCSVVSTELGAMGIRREVCGEMLHVVKGGEWKAFAELIVHCWQSPGTLPEAFFKHYYWGNIMDRVVGGLGNYNTL